MKNINWFKYRQYLGYVIDLARIFPIINKQRGSSKIIWGLYTHIIEIPNIIWSYVLELANQIQNVLASISPWWVYDFSLTNLSVYF